MEKEGAQEDQVIRKLKKGIARKRKLIIELKEELASKRKLVEEIKASKMKPEDIVALHFEMIAAKDDLTKETMASIRKLSSQLANLLVEEVGVSVTKEKISQLLKRWSESYPMIVALRKTSINQPMKFYFCREFFFHYDWLNYAKNKCHDLINTRDNLKKNIEQQMDEYQYGVKFIEEDGSVRKEDLVMKEVQNLIKELIDSQDEDILKSGKPFENMMQLWVWVYQMEHTSNTIIEYLEKNGITLEILAMGVEKVEAFMGAKFEEKIASCMQSDGAS